MQLPRLQIRLLFHREQGAAADGWRDKWLGVGSRLVLGEALGKSRPYRDTLMLLLAAGGPERTTFKPLPPLRCHGSRSKEY